ncbi:hypothetical protein Q5P01_020143 [Channa striata]|uniref:Uncharacterized protein n=1 Tax=Channa striata TaxID=64152 RepID=A0AA88LXT7_CHASR|nr:hypothetical protein Q5P01_020143 [Channa striata]
MPWHVGENNTHFQADQNKGCVPTNMDHLAFKYMEMCKVQSSTDSDSEISPRWSDTSTMGCVSSAPESGTVHQTLPLKAAARHGCYSLFLDPYDGSSEDSDESNIDAVVSRQTKQQGLGGGGCRFSGCSRRLMLLHPASVALREEMETGIRDPATEQQNLLDAQIKHGTGSQLWVSEPDTLPSPSDKDGCRELAADMATDSTTHTQTMDTELCMNDSGLQATLSPTPQTSGLFTPMGESSSQMLHNSPERSPSPCNLRSIYKRKLGLPGAEVLELGQRKRQCVVDPEDKQGSV